MRPRMLLAVLDSLGHQHDLFASFHSPGTTLVAGAGELFVLNQALFEHLSFVDPHLYADTAIGGLGFCKAVINVRAQGLQRDGSLMIAFAAGDVRAAQTAGNRRS